MTNRDKQTGPAIGQKYWACPSMRALHLYNADDYDLSVRNFCDLYPEERFAEAELRAKELIVGVNKRRRELNEGKEFGESYLLMSFPHPFFKTACPNDITTCEHYNNVTFTICD